MGIPALNPKTENSYDFVVVANRLPVDRITNPDGTQGFQRSPGGLVTALEPVMASSEGAWVGWHGGIGEELESFDKDADPSGSGPPG